MNQQTKDDLAQVLADLNQSAVANGRPAGWKEQERLAGGGDDLGRAGEGGSRNTPPASMSI